MDYDEVVAVAADGDHAVFVDGDVVAVIGKIVFAVVSGGGIVVVYELLAKF